MMKTQCASGYVYPVQERGRVCELEQRVSSLELQLAEANKQGGSQKEALQQVSRFASSNSRGWGSSATPGGRARAPW